MHSTLCLDDPTIMPIVRMLIFLGFLHSTSTKECSYDECKVQAKRFLESIDETISPCDDFVEFACGKQFKKFDNMKKSCSEKSLEPTTYRLNLWKMRKKLQTYLSQPRRIDDTRTMKLARIFWKACKNITTVEALVGVRLLFKRLGEWPVITEYWNSKHFTWEKFSRCARNLGFLPRMFIHIGLNIEEITKPWNYNDTIKLTVERPKYVDLDITEEKFMMQSIGYLKIAKKLTDKKIPNISEINEALVFAWKLHKLNCSNGFEPKKRFTIARLQKKYPITNWIKYLRGMLTKRQRKYLSDKNCVIVDTCYISSFLNASEQVDRRTLANYAFLAIIDDLFNLIRPQLSIAFASNQLEIEQICFDSTSVIFNFALDVVIANEVNKRLKEIVETIQNHIYNVTIHIIHRVPWMDSTTQQQARKKLENMLFKIPFPDDLRNDNYFIRLDYVTENSLNSLFREINTFLVDHYYLKTGSVRAKYFMDKPNSSITNIIFEKKIHLTDAVMKFDLFSKTVYTPEAALELNELTPYKELAFLNYASIGLQIAAALSHHMYQKGAYVDHKGQWQFESWWSDITQEQFMSRESCQAIQTVKRIMDASTVFGFIGASEIAYMSAFQACSDELCNTYILPGLNYTKRQLFWINAVASDCDRNLKQRYNTMVSHSENFKTDFQCNSSAKMNTKNKCKMWIT
ncbi:neprilysin-2-like [Chelonus insularis]|uniref:neprilysin-2-like n=1 Tax=Chelonus insularis TaxID=460826 RepID=UPI00158D6B0B|nr:neprilysin-2-like [Chelonus insularis]